MINLQLPLWIVLEQPRTETTGARTRCLASTAVAFTATHTAVQYVAGNLRRHKIEFLETPEELLLFVADLHAAGVRRICINPNQYGRGGRLESLADILSFAECELKRELSLVG